VAKIGTIKIETGSGTKEVPVFETSDVDNDILRVETDSGVGALNLVDPSQAELNQLRIHTENQGVLAVGTSVGGDLTASTTLNGQTAEVTVYEDTTGDGTADNIETVTLGDGVNSYNLSNISGGSGNDYWLGVNLTNSDIEKTAKIDYIELAV
jgi:hypothetical protein